MSGIGRYFKEHRPNVKIVAVDPQGSILGPYFRTKTVTAATPYLVEGIGEDMIPRSMQFEFLDDFVEVGDRESFLYARRLAREEGLFVGGSSGSAVAGALKWLGARPLPEGSTVVVLLPDSGDRYLSKFYSDEWMHEKGMVDPGSTAHDLIERKVRLPPLIFVEPTARVADALGLLEMHGISQMPILRGDENVGSVQEEEVLRRVLADETIIERTVTHVATPPFEEIRSDTPVSTLLERLKAVRAVLLRDPTTGKAVGLLTRHDLLSYLSEEGSPHAL